MSEAGGCVSMMALAAPWGHPGSAPPRWAEGFCGFVRALLSLHCHRAPAPHTASPCTHAVLTHAVLAEEE